MISRDINVIEIMNSQLLYPSIWAHRSLFSTNEATIQIPYNRHVGDLEFENPDVLFHDFNDNKKDHAESSIESDCSKHEKFEMEYNYIYMEKI